MKPWQGVLIGVGVGASIYAVWNVSNKLAKKQLAFQVAESLAQTKGIINLGAGPHKSFLAQEIAHSPDVVANVDIVPNGMPHLMQLDLEQIPYPFKDKQFDVCFTSHTLEHLTNWQEALTEMQRVADWVVLVLPHPHSPGFYLTPGHKQFFSYAAIESLRQIPGVIVYC